MNKAAEKYRDEKSVKLIALTQGMFAIVDANKFEYLNKIKWCYNKNGSTGYAVGRRHGVVKRMHRMVIGAKSGKQVDHINGDGTDNRLSNLRIANHSQNRINARKIDGCSSKFKGVAWNKKDKAWLSWIRYNGVWVYLGFYRNEVDASIAYDFAAYFLFGEFARLNHPNEDTEDKG